VAMRHQDRIVGTWSVLLAQVGQPQLQMFIAPNRPN
jgi:hypothetical protein